MFVPKKLPDVVGFYLPGDRRQDHDNRAPDPKTGEMVVQPTMTKQSFVAECDINNIVRDFTQHGMVTHINERAQQGAFVDLPDGLDFQAAVEIARAGEAAFMQLPAQVRRRFDNDPSAFLDFLANDKNRDEAIELGLIERPVPPPAPKEPETPPPEAPKS